MENSFDVSKYLNRSVGKIAAGALRSSLQNPRESSYIIKFTAAARRAEKIRMKHEKEGRHIPAFLIASISTACNLNCTGCYARATQNCSDKGSEEILPPEKWDGIFAEAREIGVSFILLAGGEPLLRKDILEYAAAYPEIIFPVFTNGTMVRNDYLSLFDANRNLVPILSIEGGRELTDARRGPGIYDQLTDVMSRLTGRDYVYVLSGR